MLSRFRSQSVFALLLLNTVVSTLVVAFVSIASLQRVADEHPRRYLSKALFHQFASSIGTGGAPGSDLDGSVFEMYPLDRLPQDSGLPFDYLLAQIRRDPDHVAITTHQDRYLAATISGNNLVVLPQFGQFLSTQARLLVGLVALTILLVLVLNYFAIRYLTSPFLVFKTVVKNVDDGNLSYRIPLEKTYGEFKDLANSFNGMLGRLEHVNTARKHMLLAIPHEVRTPLARLKVRKDLITDPELKSEIARDINSLENILDTILDTERIQTNGAKVVRKEIHSGPFIDRIGTEFLHYRNLSFVIDPRINTFHADEFLISLLIKNLISNSIRYGRNKPIIVELAPKAEDAGTLVLSVTDQGVGIPKDKIPYVTEPFWRLDESRQRNSGGFGLGMYLCKRIVGVHDGELDIVSEPQVGTRVVVTLPGALRVDPARG